MTAQRGWARRFEEPIKLPDGRALATLRQAGDYITELPEATHTAAEWQAAMEALILVATLGGPTMFARIGIMRALNRHVSAFDVQMIHKREDIVAQHLHRIVATGRRTATCPRRS